MGQTSEEALFGNRGHSPALDTFLEMLGHRVSLASHQGYRGGLDTQFGQTGRESVYTEHCGNNNNKYYNINNNIYILTRQGDHVPRGHAAPLLRHGRPAAAA